MYERIATAKAQHDHIKRDEMHWQSADGQREIDMSGMSPADALAELLNQCTDDEEEASVMAGAFFARD